MSDLEKDINPKSKLPTKPTKEQSNQKQEERNSKPENEIQSINILQHKSLEIWGQDPRCPGLQVQHQLPNTNIQSPNQPRRVSHHPTHPDLCLNVLRCDVPVLRQQGPGGDELLRVRLQNRLLRPLRRGPTRSSVSSSAPKSSTPTK